MLKGEVGMLHRLQNQGPDSLQKLGETGLRVQVLCERQSVGEQAHDGLKLSGFPGRNQGSEGNLLLIA